MYSILIGTMTRPRHQCNDITEVISAVLGGQEAWVDEYGVESLITEEERECALELINSVPTGTITDIQPVGNKWVVSLKGDP